MVVFRLLPLCRGLDVVSNIGALLITNTILGVPYYNDMPPNPIPIIKALIVRCSCKVVSSVLRSTFVMAAASKAELVAGFNIGA